MTRRPQSQGGKGQTLSISILKQKMLPKHRRGLACGCVSSAADPQGRGSPRVVMAAPGSSSPVAPRLFPCSDLMWDRSSDSLCLTALCFGLS